MSSHVVGILLAAGAGSRYGSPKALAHGGEWLKLAISALLDGGCDEVLVVLGAAEVPWLTGEPDCTSTAKVSVVRNSLWREGMGSSLRVGLDALAQTEAQLAVIHLVDTPDVGPDVVARVVSAAKMSVRPSEGGRARAASKPTELRACLARAYFGAVPGHPVVVGRRFWGEVIASAVGDVGARQFFRDRDDLLKVQCSDLATGRDHDTPDGHAEANWLE